MNDPTPSYRLPLRRHRMGRADFQRAYSRGRRARGELFTVVVVPNTAGRRRLGLSVGKRCWKRAVRRNRVRRVFREAFRLTRERLPPGIDLVMIASTPGLEPRLEPCRAELERLAWKAWRRWEEASTRESAP